MFWPRWTTWDYISKYILIMWPKISPQQRSFALNKKKFWAFSNSERNRSPISSSVPWPDVVIELLQHWASDQLPSHLSKYLFMHSMFGAISKSNNRWCPDLKAHLCHGHVAIDSTRETFCSARSSQPWIYLPAVQSHVQI